MPLQKLTALQVQEFVNRMLECGVTRWGRVRGASPKSVQDGIVLLKQALSQAVEWGMLPHNPAAKVRLPKAVRKEIGVLTE